MVLVCSFPSTGGEDGLGHDPGQSHEGDAQSMGSMLEAQPGTGPANHDADHRERRAKGEHAVAKTLDERLNTGEVGGASGTGGKRCHERLLVSPRGGALWDGDARREHPGNWTRVVVLLLRRVTPYP